MINPNIIDYLRKQGFLSPAPAPAAAQTAAPAPAAPPAPVTAGIDGIEAPPTLVGATPPAPAPTPAPAPAPVKPSMGPAAGNGSLDWKGALAVSLGGIGDALKAGGGDKSGGGAATAMKTIQEAPERAMAAHERARTLNTQSEQDNPESEISKAQAALLTKMGTDPAKLKGLSYTQMQPMAAITEKAFGVDATTKERLLQAQMLNETNRLRIASEAGLKQAMFGEKTDQFNQKEFDKIVKDNDPNLNSRSPIGMIGKTNINATRALTTLSKPMVTNQEAGNAMADLAAIYQNGSPTEFGMSHQEYKSAYGKVQELLQMLTGKPQDALPDAIKKRLVGDLTDMRKDNAKILRNQFDQVEGTKSNIIKNYSDQWKNFRSRIEGNFGPGEEANTPPPGGGDNAKMPTITDEQSYKKLPAGAEYLDAQGNHRRKKA